MKGNTPLKIEEPVSASRPGEWALPTVFDFNELMRHVGATD
jgi:hypothetical protein